MVAKGSDAGENRPRRIDRSPAPAPEPGGEPPLSLERIVTTAVDMLDTQGLDGLTMRGLANRLGAGAMSLYWHVANKDAVFDLALDSVLQYGGPPSTIAPQDWRGQVVHMLGDWRAGMLRHPWSASLLPRRALGPNILRRLELLGETLSSAGVADTDLNVAIWTLWNYVLGATVTRASFDLSDDDRAAAQERLTGLSLHFPTIERSRLLLDNDWDGAFTKGLDFPPRWPCRRWQPLVAAAACQHIPGVTLLDAPINGRGWNSMCNIGRILCAPQESCCRPRKI